MKKKFYSNGKLLLTGEYAVLDGALALAVPTKYGQSFEVTENNSGELSWVSYDDTNSIWFKAIFDINNLDIRTTSNIKVANTLRKILLAAIAANEKFLTNTLGVEVKTKLGFPRDWGLGSSSTLINNIAQWSHTNAYNLLWNVFKGSGYDIACAQNDSPILYHVLNSKPKVQAIDFKPTFSKNLYFVHLNQKQNSREAISAYRMKNFDENEFILSITNITKKIVVAKTLEGFETLVYKHENLLSNILKTQPVKERLFSNYSGAIKSLGAWGGDFILVTGNKKTPEYFKSRGFNTVISYKEMVL